MYQQQFYILANMLMAADAVIMLVTGYFAYSLSLDYSSNSLVMAWTDFLGIVLFLLVLNNFLMGKFSFYSQKRFPSYWGMSWYLLLALLIQFTVLSAGAIFVGIQPFSRTYVLLHFLMSLICLFAVRIAFYMYLDQRANVAFNSRRILLVGTKKRIDAVAKAITDQRSWGHQIVGYLNGGRSVEMGDGIPLLGSITDFDKVLHEQSVDEVIFTLPKTSPVKLESYMDKCERMGILIRIVPSSFDFDRPTMRVERIQSIPTLAYYSINNFTASGLLYKKVLDLVGGAVGFFVFVFMYIVIGLAIKIDSPGPILFKQRRVAQNGRIFNLYKFRSMTSDAEEKKADLLKHNEMNGAIFKMKNDPRVTRVGKFLRKTSLDEFPQFINVLKGEISLVGTRPPTPDEVAQYEDWQRRRISLKPGITGLWQISGRNLISDFNEVVKLDLEYIDQWRFSKDLLILWKTVWVVFAGRGAR
jgi:exopolysaccharide biosynthesis polyprenyl glycosylphosphotransferase